jgi:hypothetical protein
LSIGELAAETAFRAVLAIVEEIFGPPVRWVGYLLVKYVFLLGRRDVRSDHPVVVAVGFVACLVAVLAGYELWDRLSEPPN